MPHPSNPQPPDHISCSSPKPGICPAHPGCHPACPSTRALESPLQQLRTPVLGSHSSQLFQASRLYFPSDPEGREHLSILLPTLFQFLATLPHSPYTRICCGVRGVSRGLLPPTSMFHFFDRGYRGMVHIPCNQLTGSSQASQR